MFYGCESLNSLDLSNFNADNVKSMSGMFSGCKSLTSLNISNFNIPSEKILIIHSLFYLCNNLKKDNIKYNTEVGNKTLINAINSYFAKK